MSELRRPALTAIYFAMAVAIALFASAARAAGLEPLMSFGLILVGALVAVAYRRQLLGNTGPSWLSFSWLILYFAVWLAANQLLLGRSI
jgi:hypothetical protein